MRHVTIRERNEMRRLRARGVTQLELAAMFNRSAATVHHHVHDVPSPVGGWTTSAPKRKFDHDEAAVLHGEGVSFYELADRFGVTASAVHKAVSKARQQRGEAA